MVWEDGGGRRWCRRQFDGPIDTNEVSPVCYYRPCPLLIWVLRDSPFGYHVYLVGFGNRNHDSLSSSSLRVKVLKVCRPCGCSLGFTFRSTLRDVVKGPPSRSTTWTVDVSRSSFGPCFRFLLRVQRGSGFYVSLPCLGPGCEVFRSGKFLTCHRCLVVDSPVDSSLFIYVYFQGRSNREYRSR